MTNQELAIQIDKDIRQLVKKMVRIVIADTNKSRVYADMLLSMLPNSEHKVNINLFCKKANQNDKEIMLDLIENSNTKLILNYERYVLPHKDLLLRYVKSKKR